MIKARHHWFYYPFFRLYSRYLPRWDFRAVNLHSDLKDKRLPVFMVGNHFSWWDGFLALHINMETFKRKFHIMMLEEQLENRMFLNKAGAYSIKRGSRSMIESLNYTNALLADAGNMVVMFPQGAIQSIHDQPQRFEKGWYRVIDRLHGPVQFIFYHALVDYYSHRKPTLNIFLYEYDYAGGTASDAEAAFNENFQKSLKVQTSYL
jgi:1-acyl-sn-glycerol-3-phosphate acyltransferase